MDSDIRRSAHIEIANIFFNQEQDDSDEISSEHNSAGKQFYIQLDCHQPITDSMNFEFEFELSDYSEYLPFPLCLKTDIVMDVQFFRNWNYVHVRIKWIENVQRTSNGIRVEKEKRNEWRQRY